MKRINIIIITVLILALGLSACSINKKENVENRKVKKNNTLSLKNKNSLKKDKNINRYHNDKNGSNNDSLKYLQKKGLVIFENQSSWVELKNWGKVRFVSGRFRYNGINKLKFYLVNNRGKIIYKFPDFYGNQWTTVYELKKIIFKDINNDGYKDIIVIADYITGVGSTGATPFHVGGIYFQKDKTFVSIPELDKKINDSKQNDTIEKIMKVAEGENIKFNK